MGRSRKITLLVGSAIAEFRSDLPRYGDDLQARYKDQLQAPPVFLDEVDQVMLLWQAPLADTQEATGAEMVVA